MKLIAAPKIKGLIEAPSEIDLLAYYQDMIDTCNMHYQKAMPEAIKREDIYALYLTIYYQERINAYIHKMDKLVSQ